MKHLLPLLLLGLTTASAADNAEPASAPVPPAAKRFTAPKDFDVELVAAPDDTGSLVAMTFNEWGQIVAARENGPLLLISFDEKSGKAGKPATFCSELKNCQGLLALNGQVFAVADGAEGAGLYRVADDDHDGTADDVERLLKFTGKMGEHGPHGIVLGPDGLLYIVTGNRAAAEGTPLASSPLRHIYEGDLVQPRYEDAGGQNSAVKAPAGAILRTDTEGSFVELFAGGMRNAYDLAFNREGDLFTADSDTEGDIGLPWYRPPRVYHVIPSADFGWRSGWAVWPDYYLDTLPAVFNLKRGSPTGMEFYNHDRYPARFHNAMFLADWSRGRIMALHFDRSHGSYEGSGEVFLQGNPLNATDLAVGKEGWLYFCTGGRGTEGGVYRVTCHTTAAVRSTGVSAKRALHEPQFASAYAREQIATIKEDLGSQWDTDLIAVLKDQRATPADRARVLDILRLYGPAPETSQLILLSQDKSPEVRAKAADLMGLYSDDDTGERLIEMLDDREAVVRRKSLEALMRGGQQAPAETLLELLADSDRTVVWAARRALAQMPTATWRREALNSTRARVFFEASTALLAAGTEPATIHAIIARSAKLMNTVLPDEDFLALLRLLELALDQGGLGGQDVPALRKQLAEEYPALEPRINRELVRLLVHLQEPTLTERYLAELDGKAIVVEKLHLAAHCRFLREGWTSAQKLKLLTFYENARALHGGQNLAQYIDNLSRDFVAGFTESERRELLAASTRLPGAALWGVASLPDQPGQEVLAELIRIDRQLSDQDPLAKRLGLGIASVLGGSKDPVAMVYLREVFEKQPERRQTTAMALAQSPGGENWPILVKSLPMLEGASAQEVLRMLAQADETPDQPEPFRQAILCGVRLGDQGGDLAVKLLEKWTGQKQARKGKQKPLAAWQQWFVRTYPHEPEPKPSAETAGTNWTAEELLRYLASSEAAAAANASRGEQVFAKAQCIKCHRFGDRGEGIGPDLTTVSKRFQTKEVLESILFPSRIVSDQYASQGVETADGLTYNGIVAEAGNGAIIILQSSGEKITLRRDQIAEMVPSRTSSMPEGLLNRLTREEIGDLLAYLASDTGDEPLQAKKSDNPLRKAGREPVRGKPLPK